MFKRIGRLQWTIGALLLTVAAAAVTARSMGANSTPEPSLLQSVSTQDLRKGGVGLREATPAELAGSKVTREQAEALALYQFAGGQIFESKLLVATDTFADNGITCLCWVISSDPDGEPYIHQPIPIDGQSQIKVVADKSFRLDFVDAVSGKWLYGAEHSDVHNETVQEPSKP